MVARTRRGNYHEGKCGGRKQVRRGGLNDGGRGNRLQFMIAYRTLLLLLLVVREGRGRNAATVSLVKFPFFFHSVWEVG